MRTVPPTEKGKYRAIATDAIINGKPVVVNTDGTVSVVSGVSGGFGTAVEFEDARTNNSGTVKAAFDSNSNKVVIAYIDVANSSYGTAIVGTVSASDNSISFGTAVVFESAEVDYVYPIFDSSQNKILIAFTDRGDSKKGKTIVGTVSGTSISFGTAVTFATPSGANSIVDHAPVFDSNANKTALFFNDFDDGQSLQCRVVSISGTTPSYGTQVEVASQANYGGDALVAGFDSNANKVVVFYTDSTDSNKGKARVGTISGTDISFGTAAEFEAGAYSQHMHVAFDTTNNKFVLNYQDTGNSAYGTVVVGTVSGTDISFGTPVVWASVNSVTNCGIAYDSSTDRLFISGYYSTNSKGYYVIGQVSGTTVTVTTPAVYLDFTLTQAGSPLYEPNAQRIVIPYIINPSGVNDRHGFAIVYGTDIPTNLTTENYIGIATGGSYADGQSVTVDVIGTVNDDQSSLTAGQQYFVQEDGTLGLTADSTSVVAGTAISATELIVKE